MGRRFIVGKGVVGGPRKWYDGELSPTHKYVGEEEFRRMFPTLSDHKVNSLAGPEEGSAPQPAPPAEAPEYQPSVSGPDALLSDE